jgi:acyl-coenzyme A synthetase/AMP-(fatty) acid ligase
VWCHGFGSTEQSAPTTRLTAADVTQNERRIDSVWRGASTFFEVAVVDDKGKKMPDNRAGEIVVRSAMSTSQYWELPDKNKAAFFAGNWFRTGDIGHLDQDGFLYYLDRDKDKVVTSGGVVYPHVVETAILRHAAVANCGVIGLGKAGKQDMVAGVLLTSGQKADATLAADIIKRASADLAPHERPQRVMFVDELPTVLGGAKSSARFCKIN